MTADMDKTHGTVCLICNASIGVSTRNSCPIFQINVTSSEQPVANILSVVLGQEIRQESVHSDIVCKKCYKLCNEVDELQERLTEIKMEINCYYQKTLRKLESGSNAGQDEDRDPLLPIIRPAQGPRSQSLRVIKSEKQADVEIVDEEEDVDGRGIGLDDPRDADFIPSERLLSKKGPSSTVDNLRRVQEALMNASSPGSLEYRIKLENTDDLMEEEEIQVIEGVDETDDNGIIELSGETRDGGGDTNDGSADDSQARPQVARRKIKPRTNDVPNVIPQMIISREGKLYTCLLCPVDEKVQGEARSLITHMKEVHNIRIYICDMCGMEFLKRAEMSAHFDEHVANEEGEFQCNVCQRVFNNLRLFCVHKRMHMPQQKNHSCDSCDKTFTSKSLLDEHMNTHTGSRPYKCADCGKEFASKYSAKSHEKTHLDRPRPFKCSQCSKTFITEQNLLQHEKTHTAAKSFTCNDCGKSFSSARNLEVHTVIHKGYKPFGCRICGKAFARKAEIRDHERTHTGEKPYQCEFCGSTFGQRSNLQSHKRATHYDDKRYQCVECGKAFKRRRLLDYHIKAAHTGERPYKCQICSATFIYPEHFKKHRRIHTGEKPYACEVCGKAFNSRDNRNAHRFVHSDKKPYECLVCGMGFMRKPQLYNHMQAQGHVNDTIVVNQPRLTSEEDVITTLPSEQVEMIIPHDEINTLEGGSRDSKMYISELKEHVIIRQSGSSSTSRRVAAGSSRSEPAEETIITDGQYSEEVGHLIIDGQVQFADGETLELDDGTAIAQGLTVEGQPLVIPPGRHQTADTAEFTVETSEGGSVDGSVQLVHIAIPESGDSHQWFNIVHQ